MLAVLAGCQKSDSNELKKTQDERPETTSRYGLARSGNPFEHVGINHNEVVTAYMNYIHADGDTSRLERLKFITAYSRKQFGKDVLGSPDMLEYQVDRKTCLGYYQKMNFDKESVACIGDMWDIIESLGKDSDYERVQKDLLDRELTISQLDVPDKEKESLYKAAAIARYSTALWKKEILDKPLMKNGKSLFSRLLATVMIAHADFTGAGLGMLLGDVDGTSADLSSFAWELAYINGIG